MEKSYWEMMRKETERLQKKSALELKHVLELKAEEDKLGKKDKIKRIVRNVGIDFSEALVNALFTPFSMGGLTIRFDFSQYKILNRYKRVWKEFKDEHYSGYPVDLEECKRGYQSYL